MPALARLPHDMTWQGKHPSLAQCDAAVLAPRARIAPQVVGFFMDKNKKYKMTAELTEASLATFAAGVEDGTAPVEYKSAPVPEEGEDKEGEVQVRGAVATALHCTAPHWLRCINLYLALLGLMMMPFAPPTYRAVPAVLAGSWALRRHRVAALEHSPPLCSPVQSARVHLCKPP